MEHPWGNWLRESAETLGVTMAFAFGGAGFSLWFSAEAHTLGRGLVVILAGQIVSAAATTFFLGYLGWSLFLAPGLGIVCGLVAMPLMNAVYKVGRERMADVINAGLRRVIGKKGGQP